MNKIATILLGCLLAIAPSRTDAAGELTLEDLCRGAYSAKRISGIHPMNDGETFSRLSPDRKQIVTYSFKDGSHLSDGFRNLVDHGIPYENSFSIAFLNESVDFIGIRCSEVADKAS